MDGVGNERDNQQIGSKRPRGRWKNWIRAATDGEVGGEVGGVGEV